MSDDKASRRADDLGVRMPGSGACRGRSSSSYGAFVNNLPLNVRRDELCQLFEPFSRVHQVNIVRRPDFTSHCYAFVLLNTDNDTRRAIQKLDGSYFRARRIKVEATFGKASHIFDSTGPGKKGEIKHAGQDYTNSSPRGTSVPSHRFRSVKDSGSSGNRNTGSRYGNRHRSKFQHNAGSRNNGPNSSPGCSRWYDTLSTDDCDNDDFTDVEAREITRMLRDSWEHPLPSAPKHEEWPSFDDLLEEAILEPDRKSLSGYSLPIPEEYPYGQPTSWPISDNDEGCVESSKFQSMIEVLRWRHGDKEVDECLNKMTPEMNATQKAEYEVKTDDGQEHGADDTLLGGRREPELGFTEDHTYVNARQVENIKASMTDDEGPLGRHLSDQDYLFGFGEPQLVNSVAEERIRLDHVTGERSSRIDDSSHLVNQKKIVLARQKPIVAEVKEWISRLLAAQARKKVDQDHVVFDRYFEGTEDQEGFQEDRSGDEAALGRDAEYQVDAEEKKTGHNLYHENADRFKSHRVGEVNQEYEEGEQKEPLSHDTKELQVSSQASVMSGGVRECCPRSSCPVCADVSNNGQESKAVAAANVGHARQNSGNCDLEANEECLNVNSYGKLVAAAKDHELDLTHPLRPDVLRFISSTKNDPKEEKSGKEDAELMSATEAVNIGNAAEAGMSEKENNMPSTSSESSDENKADVIQEIVEAMLDAVVNHCQGDQNETLSMNSVYESDDGQDVDGDEEQDEKKKKRVELAVLGGQPNNPHTDIAGLLEVGMEGFI